MSTHATAFGAAAARLSGHVGLLLGWHPDQFWAATPAEVASAFAAVLPPEGEGVTRDTLNALLERETNG